MGHIYNHNRTPFTFKLDRSESWDFFLDSDSYLGAGYSGSDMSGCVAANIDTNDGDCVFIEQLISNTSWEHAKNDNVTLNNIGLTGMDNGLITFDRERVSNSEFVNLLTEGSLNFDNYGTKLVLNKVSGNNGIFCYGNDIVEKDGIVCARLNGGFFQGIFKSGEDYKLLPTNIGNGITLEFAICPDSSVEKCGLTLNDRYPENNGTFFYIGTRAENKWSEYYDVNEITFERIANTYFGDEYNSDGLYLHDFDPNTSYFSNTDPYALGDFFADGYNVPDCPKTRDNLNYGGVETCGCGARRHKNNYFADSYASDGTDSCVCGENYVLGEYEGGCDIEYDPNIAPVTTGGHDLSQPNLVEIETDNKFILFDRTCEGFTTENWVEGTKMVITDVKSDPKENYFLLYHRGCGGLTADKTWGNKGSRKYDVTADLYRNAFGLKVDGEGRLSYRYLVRNCECEGENCTPYIILSEETSQGLLPDGEWHVVHVKFEPVGPSYDIKCDYTTSANRKMRMSVYVDGKLKLVSKEIPTFNFKELNDTLDKQEGVPFNISVGGGTQGLCDVIYPDFMRLPDKVYPLEKEFGGSMFGYFRGFAFYACPLGLEDIRNAVSAYRTS